MAKNKKDSVDILLSKIDKLDEKFDERLSKLDTYMHSIDKTLIKQHKELEFHIARTTQLEDEYLKIDQRLLPVENHVKHVSSITTTIWWIAKFLAGRSEERRVGKECSYRWSR